MLPRFARYLLPYWRQGTVVLVLLCVSTACSLAPPYLMKVIIDEVFPSQDFELLVLVLCVLFGLSVFGALTMFGVDYLYNWIGCQIMSDLRHGFFDHLMRLPQAFYDTQRSGDVLFRINQDVARIQFILSATLLRLLHSTVSLVAISAMLCWLNAWLFAVSLVMIPLFLVNLRYFQPRIRAVVDAGQKKQAELVDFLKERLESVKLIQGFNGYPHERGRLTGIIQPLIGINMQEAVYQGTMGGISTLLVSLSPLLVFGWGGYQIIAGTMTLGAVIAFLNYLLRIFGPIQQLNTTYIDLVRAGVSMRRVVEFMDMPNELQLHAEREPLEARGAIAFEGVSFGYNGTPVLEGLELVLEPGRCYGLCGPSGCGKSTLVNLLLRFSEAEEGRVTVGGTDLRRADVDDLRSKVALVPQETLLLHDTLDGNLRYGSWAATEEGVERAAEVAGLTELLGEAGREAPIGDRGVQLSGGQKQRLAIARALLRDADVLVLDEATSALDAESERRVIEGIRREYAGRTMVVVSHRASVLAQTDEVVCLVAGKVVERGSHEELLDRRGWYHRLLQSQEREETIAA